MKWSLLSVIVISTWYTVLADSNSFTTEPVDDVTLISGRESQDPVLTTKHCRKPATCEKLNNPTCYGVRLPYASTSLDYVPDVKTQDDVQSKLLKWKGLIHIPRCWSVIQPFLCALYMPKCENGTVDLPSKEMCEIIQSPCSILQTDDLWPSEFRCNASYESTCPNDVRELKFNTIGECKAPLTKATNEAAFYEGAEGCGVQCHDPYFTDEERQNVRSTIRWAFTISYMCNGFAVVTYVMNWPFSRKFPGQAVFWMNVCFFTVSLGFIRQFLTSNDQEICHADGTLRKSEPSRENLACVINFVSVYSFLMAGIMWCIIFAYTSLLRFFTYDKMKKRCDEWSAYYHIVAWSVPSALTVIVAAMQQVDGDGLLGICFVGVVNKDMKLIFFLGPLLVLIITCAFLGICIVRLFNLQKTSEEIMSVRAKRKVRQTIIKLSLFLLSTILFVTVTSYCQYYDWHHHHSWKKSFRSNIVCQLGVVGTVPVEDCRMESRPNVSMIQVQLLILSFFSISAAAWIFTSSSTPQTWKRFARVVMRKETEEPIRLKKYKVIARAFEKRKCLNSEGLNSDGALSIDIRRSQQDPVDLDFDLNSVGSNENSSWAKIIPRLMTRRGALVPASPSHSNSGQWWNSTDSEISYSMRRISVESRSHSLDSTVFVQAVAEKVQIRQCSKTRREHRERARSCSPDTSSRRNSNISDIMDDGDLEAEVLKALNIGFRTHGQEPTSIPRNENRRMAITGIELSTMKMLKFGRSISERMMRSGSQPENDFSHSTSDKSEEGSDTNSS